MSRPTWSDQALDELADIWVRATPDERTAIQARVEYVNLRLDREPLTFGEEREGNIRADVHPVLTVWFSIRDGQRARVTHVHRPPRRRSS